MIKKRYFKKAHAVISGGNGYPDIRGYATFEQTEKGVLVTVRLRLLPVDSTRDGGLFAMHIHDGESCTGDFNDQFSNAKTHYNPTEKSHPHHAGDLPTLIGCNGAAYLSVLTNRFTIDEIVNKVIVIHNDRDDYTTQPAGNSGIKIACGKIIKG